MSGAEKVIFLLNTDKISLYLPIKLSTVHLFFMLINFEGKNYKSPIKLSKRSYIIRILVLKTFALKIVNTLTSFRDLEQTSKCQ